MQTHVDMEHPEVEDSSTLFRADVITSAPSALVRMVREAVLIREYEGDNLLNDVMEYNRCLLPELTTKVGLKMREEPTKTREIDLDSIHKMTDNKRVRENEVPKIPRVKERLKKKLKV